MVVTLPPLTFSVPRARKPTMRRLLLAHVPLLLTMTAPLLPAL